MATNATKRDAVKKLKATPKRTWEELLTLINPPEDFPFEPYDRQVLTHGRAEHAVWWGLLGNRYPVHMRYFNFMKQSGATRKTPYETEYEFTALSFAKFIMDTGLPNRKFEDPVIQMKDKDKGFFASNFVWKDKVQLEKARLAALAKKEKKRKYKEFILFEGKKYYKQTVNGQWEHVWDASRRGERTSSKAVGNRKVLRKVVWESYYGEPPRKTIEYINPEGDMTDPFNLQVRLDTPKEITEKRLQDYRQASADLVAGISKICAGCGASWRIIGKYVLWLREPLPEEKRFGKCEPHHDSNIKRRKRWDGPGAVVKAGLRITHAPLAADEEQSYGFQSRGSS